MWLNIAFLAVAVSSCFAATYDAVVVGSGLSGLAAAQELTNANKTFIVLEARDRVGGRVYAKKLPSGRGVEMGAEFIGPTQDRVIDTVHKLGLEFYETPVDGENIFFTNNEAKRFRDIFGALVPPSSLLDTLKMAEIQDKVNGIAKQIDPQAPWDSEHAAAWDNESVYDWIKAMDASEDVIAIIESAFQEVFSISIKKTSLLYAATYIAAAGNKEHTGSFERLTQTHPGAQQWRVSGTTSRITDGLADKIGRHNIKLNSPVKSITKNGDLYTVATRSDKEYSAKHVIVAMSPPMADKISFSPQLPHDRKKVQELWKMGSLGKAIPEYESRFWRDDGLSGMAISTQGYVRATFDSTPENKGRGSILGFIQDDQMRKLDEVDEDTIKERVAEDLVNYFGPKARHPNGWAIMRWDLEEFSGGGPTSNPPLNAFSKYGYALRKPTGNIHWAGTEASDYWIGYMEGAIRAGERAAREVV